MIRVRGMKFRDSDDAYEYFRQREVDDAAERARQPAPLPQICHNCGHAYAGAICPLCKQERPAYTAMKRSK